VTIDPIDPGEPDAPYDLDNEFGPARPMEPNLPANPLSISLSTRKVANIKVATESQRLWWPDGGDDPQPEQWNVSADVWDLDFCTEQERHVADIGLAITDLTRPPNLLDSVVLGERALDFISAMVTNQDEGRLPPELEGAISKGPPRVAVLRHVHVTAPWRGQGLGLALIAGALNGMGPMARLAMCRTHWHDFRSSSPDRASAQRMAERARIVLERIGFFRWHGVHLVDLRSPRLTEAREELLRQWWPTPAAPGETPARDPQIGPLAAGMVWSTYSGMDEPTDEQPEAVAAPGDEVAAQGDDVSRLSVPPLSTVTELAGVMVDGLTLWRGTAWLCRDEGALAQERQEIGNVEMALVRLPGNPAVPALGSAGSFLRQVVRNPRAGTLIGELERIVGLGPPVAIVIRQIELQPAWRDRQHFMPLLAAALKEMWPSAQFALFDVDPSAALRAQRIPDHEQRQRIADDFGALERAGFFWYQGFFLAPLGDATYQEQSAQLVRNWLIDRLAEDT
jgi:GNAT superfamily N-acetyltransferase